MTAITADEWYPQVTVPKLGNVTKWIASGLEKVVDRLKPEASEDQGTFHMPLLIRLDGGWSRAISKLESKVEKAEGDFSRRVAELDHEYRVYGKDIKVVQRRAAESSSLLEQSQRDLSLLDKSKEAIVEKLADIDEVLQSIKEQFVQYKRKYHTSIEKYQKRAVRELEEMRDVYLEWKQQKQQALLQLETIAKKQNIVETQARWYRQECTQMEDIVLQYKAAREKIREISMGGVEELKESIGRKRDILKRIEGYITRGRGQDEFRQSNPLRSPLSAAIAIATITALVGMAVPPGQVSQPKSQSVQSRFESSVLPIPIPNEVHIVPIATKADNKYLARQTETDSYNDAPKGFVTGPKLETLMAPPSDQLIMLSRTPCTVAEKKENRRYLIRTATRLGIDKAHALAIMDLESGGSCIVESKAGAYGPMQLMPGTAERYGVNRYVPRENIRGGLLYFRDLMRMFDHDPIKAIAAYNAGEGNVIKYGGVPPFRETQRHVRRFQERVVELKRSFLRHS